MSDIDTKELRSIDSEPNFSDDTGPVLLRLEQLEVFGVYSEGQERAAKRRFLTLFEDPHQKEHHGGQGMVTKVTNAMGEVFALKRLVYTPRQPGMSDEDYNRMCLAQEEAFEQEYRSQQVPSNIEGFPTLYGYGYLDGSPIILMEWIEWHTLSHVRESMSVNPQTLQWRPIFVAELGIALFMLFVHMEYQKTSFVHRDISPNNIMFRISRRGVLEQFESGELDLCLIDFGSAATISQFTSSSFTQSTNVLRRATLDYAAPEMLTNDIPKGMLTKLRSSPSIDVYATCSVLYELISGHAPFDFFGKEQIESPYLHKLNARVPVPQSVHRAVGEIPSNRRDPKLFQLREMIRSSNQRMFDQNRFIDSICRIDQQLGFIVLLGLNAEQKKRPSAREMLIYLQNFKRNYYHNIERCYSGESIIPFKLSRQAETSMLQPNMMQATYNNPYSNPRVIMRGDIPPGVSTAPDIEHNVSQGTTNKSRMVEPGQLRNELTIRSKRLAMLIGGTVVTTFLFTFLLMLVPSDLYCSLTVLSAEFKGELPAGIVALAAVIPPLISFACMWQGSTPDSRLFFGTIGQILATLPLVLLTWCARWSVPSAPALIGVVLLVVTALVFAVEFSIRLTSIASMEGEFS